MAFTQLPLLAEDQRYDQQQPRKELPQQYQQQQPSKLLKISQHDALLQTLAQGQQFDQRQLLQQYEQQQPPRLCKIADNHTLTDTLAQGQQFDYQQLPQQYEQQQPPKLWKLSDNDALLDPFANTGTGVWKQNQDLVPCKPTGFLMYIPVTSPDSCTMVEHMCTLALSRQQVTTYQQRVDHGGMPFPSPPYSAVPCVDNELAFSAIPEHLLNSTDQQQQFNGSSTGNVHGNCEPRLTYAATNETTFPDPSTTSPCQAPSPMSPTQPSQPPQQSQSVQSMDTGYATRKKHHHVYVPDTCPNPANSVNSVRNQDQVGKEKQQVRKEKQQVRKEMQQVEKEKQQVGKEKQQVGKEKQQVGKEKQHICHYYGCGMAFKWPHLLLEHLRRHSGEKLFKCNWLSCDKSFVTLWELERHRLKHIREKEYICKECSKKFKRSDYLIQHVKTHLKTQKGKKARKTISSQGNSSNSSSISSSLKQSLQQIAMTRAKCD